MLSCYILDDEQNAVDALKAMLEKKFLQQVKLCGSHVKAKLALEEIENLQPDIVFLDVEMPEMNGLDFLKHFPDRKFHVIFTTAHEKYALPALKAAATDYLVKPLSPQDVYDAIQKCLQKKSTHDQQVVLKTNKISITTSQGIVLLPVDEIIRVEADSNYTHFYFTNRPKFIVSKTLKEVEALLAGAPFFRIHQSHLVNIHFVEGIQSHDGDFVLLKQGHKVEISRRKKAEFLQLLKLH